MAKVNRSQSEPPIDAALQSLHDLGISATLLRRKTGATADAIIVVQRERQRLEYRAEIKRRVTPELIGAISFAFSDDTERRLLITDYVTPPIADTLRQRGIQFVDRAGNAFLNRNGLFVLISGRPRPQVIPAKTMRVFRSSGLKVLFVLLSAPQTVSAPLRTIAHAADVALGTVAQVMKGLGELGHVVDVRGTQRLANRDRLIDQWTEAYARTLQPSLELGRFAAPAHDWWRGVDPTEYHAQWGGETAAAILQRHIIPQQTIIYAESLPSRMMSEHRLKADANGPVIFRRRFWNAVPSPRAQVAPPLLIYADLLTTGDARSIEAAKRIRDAYLG